MNEQYIFRIKQLVCTTLLVDEISTQQDLFEAGYLDSLAIVSLLVALEEEFDITLSMETLDLEEFRSVESMYNLISPLIKMSA
ncbi:MAG: phosphopantetheine-binding protein [Balneolaceae bacterium]